MSEADSDQGCKTDHLRAPSHSPSPAPAPVLELETREEPDTAATVPPGGASSGDSDETADDCPPTSTTAAAVKQTENGAVPSPGPGPGEELEEEKEEHGATDASSSGAKKKTVEVVANGKEKGDEIRNSYDDDEMPDFKRMEEAAAEEEAKLQQCGLWLHPKWLQVFASPWVYLVLVSTFAFLQGSIVSGFTSVVLSSIEKRYQFSSTAVGFVAVIYDITVSICVVFVSFVGSKSHKPRWLGIGLIIMAVGCFVFALPQFVFGRYGVGDASKEIANEVCLQDKEDAVCSGSNNAAYFLFLLGNILIGLGSSPLYILGLTFIDEVFHPKKVPLCLVVVTIATVVGPSLGYGIGGIFLSIYVDPWVETNLQETDPGWVGAWWICFVFAGLLALLLAIPTLMFPRQLPNHLSIEKARRSEMASKKLYDVDSRSSVKNSSKTFVQQLKSIFTNWTYVFQTLVAMTAAFSLFGLVAFFPKYIESQFRLAASTSSLIAGGLAIPSSALGILVGGGMFYFVDGKKRGRMAAFAAMIEGFILLPFTFAFLMGCSTLDIVGVTHTTFNNSTLTSIDAANCSQSCNCTSTLFEPVCGDDGLSYFSACRAGCLSSSENDGSLTFGNCSCIATSMSSELDLLPGDLLTNSSATVGSCGSLCSTLPLFLIIMAVGVFVVFTRYIAGIIITIRCVADEERDLALGVQSVVLRVFGTIPGPLLFGQVFDSSCVFWQFDCGRRGNCWIYDNSHLRVRSLAHFLSGFILASVFSLLTWFFYPNEKKQQQKSQLAAENVSFEMTITKANP